MFMSIPDSSYYILHDTPIVSPHHASLHLDIFIYQCRVAFLVRMISATIR